ncbi:MAG: hypothetical protein KAI44_05175, partial [Methylococcales bacterium]|nr:hypothetical protein [Methylococcales bacterium]
WAYSLHRSRGRSEAHPSSTDTFNKRILLRYLQLECSHDKEKKGDLAFMSKSDRPTKEQQSELTQSELISLNQENKSLKEEVDILKKAAAYFARELK